MKGNNMSKNLNLGRSIRLGTKSAVISATNKVMGTAPVRKFSALMLSAYLKNKAAVRGEKLSKIGQLLAFIFDMACLPITWCVVKPLWMFWEVIKQHWHGARVNKALPAK